MNIEESLQDERWKRFEELRDAALDGRIAAEGMQELEALVLDESAMRRNYVEHAHQQAALRLSVAPAMPVATPMTHSGESEAPLAMKQVEQPDATHWRKSIWYAMALATTILLATSVWLLFDDRNSKTQIAMITSAEDCRWGDCTLATAEQIPLGAGILKLESGIATLRFPNVNVTMEGRVDLEIVDSNKCYVHSGRVFANVEPGGEGFVVQTPTATFVDRGTTFGVRVGQEGTSDLTVFKGRVDVNHHATETNAVARINDRVRASADKLLELGKTGFPTISEAGQAKGLPIHISTASGIGDDAYLSAGEVIAANTSTTSLLVKKPAQSEPDQWYAPWRRKAFMRFDLTGVDATKVAEATFQLQGVATNIGYASMMPDATFTLYGLIDESQDDWDANSITWLDCPANAGDSIAVDENATMLVGTFVVPQSSPQGRFEVSGAGLVKFLQTDTNDRVTFVLIPETVGEEGESYVHGFASKRHPYLAAPTLRLRIK